MRVGISMSDVILNVFYIGLHFRLVMLSQLEVICEEASIGVTKSCMPLVLDFSSVAIMWALLISFTFLGKSE